MACRTPPANLSLVSTLGTYIPDGACAMQCMHAASSTCLVTSRKQSLASTSCASGRLTKKLLGEKSKLLLVWVCSNPRRQPLEMVSDGIWRVRKQPLPAPLQW